MMQRRHLITASSALAFAAALSPMAAHAASPEGPDALIKRLSTEVLQAVRADASIKTGELGRITELVNRLVLPHVNFRRMTAASVGPAWRSATPAQQTRLQDEFKQLLVRTYAGALAQVTDQTIVVRPLRAGTGDKDVLVRTEIQGRGDPVQLDYRLEKTAEGDWKIYNFNVLGVWLVDTYRSQFAQEVNARGVDGLIAALAARNQAGGQ